MTATYYERFYPRDMDGVVAYVAPNDVVNKEDSAYDRFFEKVGTKECRDKLNAVQREALVRREPLEKKYADVRRRRTATPSPPSAAWTRRTRPSSSTTSGRFWQYSLLADCDDDPGRREDRHRRRRSGTPIDTISGFSAYTDQGLEPYTPYYYQAGTQLGSPDHQASRTSSKLYIRYGYQPPRNFVPRDIPMKFQP